MFSFTKQFSKTKTETDFPFKLPYFDQHIGQDPKVLYSAHKECNRHKMGTILRDITLAKRQG
jgi:hypothetical protein